MMPVNALPSAISNRQIHCKIHQTFHAISFQLEYLIKVQNVKYPIIIHADSSVFNSNHTCIDIYHITLHDQVNAMLILTQISPSFGMKI